MNARVLFLTLVFLVFPAIALCNTNAGTEIETEVMSVDRENGFFIIKAGANDGVEPGDGFIVHRGSEKVAEAYVIEVRPDVSAAEVLSLAPEMAVEEGDGVLFVKKEGAETGHAIKGKASAWTNLLGYKTTGPSINHQTYTVRRSSEPAETLPGAVTGAEEISINIHKDKNTVFSHADMLLRENGFYTEKLNRSNGLILAKRPIHLSILKELWSDATSSIGHNLVISIEIKKEGADTTSISAYAYREHYQKDKYIKRLARRQSKDYNELLRILSEIKKRSED